MNHRLDYYLNAPTNTTDASHYCECGEPGCNCKIQIRVYETGATRDTDEGKLDYEGFLSPLVLERYAEYLHKHRRQSDGQMRDSDNWQKGIPLETYMKSAWRHFIAWWKGHRGIPPVDKGIPPVDGIEDALCGLIFNIMGYLHELLKKRYKLC